jgi:hypothetical protein
VEVATVVEAREGVEIGKLPRFAKTLRVLEGRAAARRKLLELSQLLVRRRPSGSAPEDRQGPDRLLLRVPERDDDPAADEARIRRLLLGPVVPTVDANGTGAPAGGRDSGCRAASSAVIPEVATSGSSSSGSTIMAASTLGSSVAAVSVRSRTPPMSIVDGISARRRARRLSPRASSRAPVSSATIDSVREADAPTTSRSALGAPTQAAEVEDHRRRECEGERGRTDRESDRDPHGAIGEEAHIRFSVRPGRRPVAAPGR